MNYSASHHITTHLIPSFAKHMQAVRNRCGTNMQNICKWYVKSNFCAMFLHMLCVSFLFVFLGWSGSGWSGRCSVRLVPGMALATCSLSQGLRAKKKKLETGILKIALFKFKMFFILSAWLHCTTSCPVHVKKQNQKFCKRYLDMSSFSLAWCKQIER